MEHRWSVEPNTIDNISMHKGTSRAVLVDKSGLLYGNVAGILSNGSCTPFLLCQIFRYFVYVFSTCYAIANFHSTWYISAYSSRPGYLHSVADYKLLVARILLDRVRQDSIHNPLLHCQYYRSPEPL